MRNKIQSGYVYHCVATPFLSMIHCKFLKTEETDWCSFEKILSNSAEPALSFLYYSLATSY